MENVLLKYLANVEKRVEADLQDLGFPSGFDVKLFRKEFTDKVKNHYTDIVNMKLTLARVIESGDETISEPDMEAFKSAFKKIDKVTDSLEVLLASIMGTPGA
jgi:hypothetical protein